MIRTVTMQEAFDSAIEQLPFLRRSIAKRHFRRRPEDRDECCERMMLKLSEDPRFQDVVTPGFAQAIQGGDIRSNSPFQIDTDKLREILDLILEYLPKILALFM